MARMVKCIKLSKELPGLPFKPFQGELGQRLYDNVSMEAWRMWLEHSKMLVNEYRLDLADKKAHDILKEQCEKYFFGEGSSAPPEYVPSAAK